MNNHHLRLLNNYLPKAMSRRCPSIIPRSGEKGEKINCFSVAFDNEGEPHLLVESFDGTNLTCKKWDGNSYSIEEVTPLASLDGKDLSVVHYYGLSTIYYSGVLDFVFGYFSKFEHIKIHCYRFFNWLDSYFFNKKKLVTKQRMDLVGFLWQLKLTGADKINAFDLMGKLYGLKWILHPEGEEQKQKVEAFLSALADTGELTPTQDDNYRITGHALKAIEEYEEQERRHTDNVKIQRWALALTVAIVLLTATQAGLIKVPALFDFTVSTP